MPSIDYLELVDLLEIANSIIPNCHVRDLGLLESAAARPRTTIMGVDAYKSFEEKGYPCPCEVDFVVLDPIQTQNLSKAHGSNLAETVEKIIELKLRELQLKNN